MSQEGYLTVFNLRDFRFQKKMSNMSNNLNTSFDASPEKIAPVRTRIITILDSDSDCEINGENSNSNISNVTNTKVDTNVTNTNGNFSGSSSKKSDSVIEKENQVKYLIKAFNGIHSFEVYEVLSSVDFQIEPAMQKLTKKYGPHTFPDYDTWKKEYTGHKDSNEIKPTLKRKEEDSDLQNKYGKKRRTDNENEDNSNDSVHKFKDTRVFDSDEDSDVEISDELTHDKKHVLDFMQSATLNELQLMPSCSKKKAEAIILSRPFNGWIDLVQKLQNNKYLSTDLLNAAQSVLSTRNNIKQLMKKCTRLSQQLEFAIRHDRSIKQPPLLSPILKLTNYQLVGLNWLTVLHDQDVNGILADEMGLGKTVQVISFLAHLKETKCAKNTHLVIVPSSTLENWQNEFEKWCPELKVLLYYGSTDDRRHIRVMFSEGKHKEYDVILTTYTMVSSSPEERKMFRVTPMHYVVFDEAHMLKNMNTQRYESLIRIKAAKRILLTGTPLQNNLLELMSLLIFVMPNIFSEKTEDLKSLFQKNSKAKDTENENIPTFEKEQIEQAKRIMKPFVLRRLKKDVLQDLPKKTDIMLKIPMVPTQEEQYINLVASFKEAGSDGESNFNGVTMMSDLRKLSNHPLLLRYHYQYEQLPEMAKKLAVDPSYKDTVVQYIIDDLACMSDFEIHTLTKEFKCLNKYGLPDNLIVTSGKFFFLDRKFKELKEEGHRVLVFSQYVIMLDVMEEYLRIRNHKFLRLDGSTPVPLRQQLIDEYNGDESIFIFLLSTRAGGLGINLTAADTVIIHDIDFNPYNDKQAEDRCHRMGQTRPVSVYRLISKGTIEEGMWQMTQEKLKLEKEITSDDYENTDVKSVVSLLSSALGIDTCKATDLVSPKKKS